MEYYNAAFDDNITRQIYIAYKSYVKLLEKQIKAIFS